MTSGLFVKIFKLKFKRLDIKSDSDHSDVSAVKECLYGR